MKKVLLYLLLLLYVHITKAQFADLTLFNPDTLCASPNSSVYGDASGSSADTIIMKWGDGSIDTLEPFMSELYHPYPDPGTYTIWLLALQFGGIDSTSETVEVIESPFTIALDYTIYCTPNKFGKSVDFTNLSFSNNPNIPLTFTAWQFGDNTGTFFDSNPTHHFAESQYPHNIRLDIGNTDYGGCVIDTSFELLIPEQRKPSFIAEAGCPCNEIDFQNTTTNEASITEWQWNFGNQTTSNIEDPEITYSNPKNYLISLTSIDTGGCMSNFSKVIDVCPGEYNKTNSNDNWIAGNKAGIIFEADSIKPFSNSQITTIETAATVSDPTTGELLFYTNGETVWNANHDTMMNGVGLNGNQNASQGALIVPHPINDQQYYIFLKSGLTGINANLGFHYSLVDMNEDMGLGAVIKQNIPIDVPGNNLELMAGIQRKNEECNAPPEYFVTNFLPGPSGWDIVLYLIKEDTIELFNRTPTNIDLSLLEFLSSNIARFSPNGDKFAFTRYSPSKGFVLFDFDAATGTFSNQRNIGLSPGAYTYGCEFSPDGSKLYVQSQAIGIMQFDANAPDSTSLHNSMDTVYRSLSTHYSMYLGPDNKIYFPTGGYPNGYLACIENPNDEAPLNINPKKVALVGNVNYSLQNLVPRLPRRFIKDSTTANFSYESDCKLSNTTLNDFILDTIPQKSGECTFNKDTIWYSWTYGDGNEGITIYDNGSNLDDISNHIYSYEDSGTYSVSLIVHSSYHCYSDTITKKVYIENCREPFLYIPNALKHIRQSRP